MQKGKLLFKLVTAEDKGQNKPFNSFIGVFFVLLCVVFFCFGSKYLFDSTYDVYNEDENTLFYILYFGMLFFVSFLIVWVFNAKKKGEKSQLYIYENCVEGTAVTQSSGLSSSLENFCLSYNDISNISSMERFVIIYTQWQTYKVLAFNKHNEIIRIINMQKEQITRYGLKIEDEKEENLVEKETIKPIEYDLPIYSYNGFKPCDKETHKKYKERIGNAIGAKTKDGHWEVDSVLNERVFVCNHCHNIIAYETDFNTD